MISCFVCVALHDKLTANNKKYLPTIYPAFQYLNYSAIITINHKGGNPMYYVYSTMTCDVEFRLYKKNSSKDLSQVEKDSNGKPIRVVIKGGNGVANKVLYTPKGAVTQVSDEHMEMLKNNVSFQRREKLGFLSYDKKEVKPEKKAKDMAEKDASAPITPKDFEAGENDSPSNRVYKKKG